MDHAQMGAETYDIRVVEEDCGDLIALRKLWHPSDDANVEERLRRWWERERHHRQAVVAYIGTDTPVGTANGQTFFRMPAPGETERAAQCVRRRSSWSSTYCGLPTDSATISCGTSRAVSSSSGTVQLPVAS